MSNHKSPEITFNPSWAESLRETIVATFQWTSHHENLLIHMSTGAGTARDCGCDCGSCRYWTLRDGAGS